MILKAIKRAVKIAKSRNWDCTYWAFDIHETIVKPNWLTGQIPTEFYPYAKEALQLISVRKDIVQILYTCSHPHEIREYLTFFKGNGILNTSMKIPR